MVLHVDQTQEIRIVESAGEDSRGSTVDDDGKPSATTALELALSDRDDGVCLGSES